MASAIVAKALMLHLRADWARAPAVGGSCARDRRERQLLLAHLLRNGRELGQIDVQPCCFQCAVKPTVSPTSTHAVQINEA